MRRLKWSFYCLEVASEVSSFAEHCGSVGKYHENLIKKDNDILYSSRIIGNLLNGNDHKNERNNDCAMKP